jgi:cell division protein FtsW (lipid II flippase)
LSLRNRELAALLTVGLLTATGFATVYIAEKSQISGGSLGYAVFFFGLYLVAHVVTRLTVPLADPYLLPMAALLTAIGLTEIYRLGAGDAFRQGLWIVIGVAAFGATLFWLHTDYRVLERYKYVFGLTAIFLLFLPLAPGIGETINGSRLWIHVGSLQFQPGELGKIALIVFLAAYLREKREVLAQGRLKDWGPLLVIWGGAMLVLLATNDLGSALLYYGIFLAMLYIATARISFVAAALGLFLVGAFGVSYLTPHVRERVTNWLSPWSTHKIYCPLSGTHTYRQDCQSYQLVQSLYSIAHGGFGGTGLGHGIVTTPTGQSVVPDQNDGFSKLLAAGLSFGFAFQTFVIVGGITRVIPLTGITLPFVSYGGSSIVANFLLVAGLLLISHRANRQEGFG